MSFILDALKKAEAERQRQTGPTLLEVRITPPRRRFPLWMLIIGGLLGVNILLLGFFALRRPVVVAAAPSASATLAPAATPAPPAAAAPAAVAPAGSTPAVPATAAAVAAAAPAPAPAPATASAPSAAPDMPVQNPADLEPAMSAPNGNADNAEEPPSLSEIGGDMPNLRLDLQVYAARPSDRYALINMHRVHEGDVLPEGPRVLEIEHDGVKLSYRGTEFMLRPQ